MTASDSKPLFDRASLFQDVSELLAAYNSNGINITESTDMSVDLSIDSVAAMNLVMEVEEKFDISIPINLLSDVRTVGDLVSMVDEIMRRK